MVVGKTGGVSEVPNNTMSVAAAARRLGVSAASVRRLREDEVLVTVSVNGRRLLLASSVEDALDERRRIQRGHAAIVVALADAGLYEA